MAAPPGTALEAYLAEQAAKTTLRFLTCGSVDDGKSTLIGRLLYDSKLIFEDQLAALEADSRRQAPRATTSTSRCWSTAWPPSASRASPSTSPTATSPPTGASSWSPTPRATSSTRATWPPAPPTPSWRSSWSMRARACSPRPGGTATSPRCSASATWCWRSTRWIWWTTTPASFEAIVADYQRFAAGSASCGSRPFPCRRCRATTSPHGARMPWYRGPTLLEHLETVQVGRDLADRPFRMPVQWVNRPNLDFRGFSGTVSSGVVRPGDAVRCCPRAALPVTRMVTFDGDLEAAQPGQAVTLVLADEIDVSRGDVIAAAQHPPQTSDQLAVHLLWMSDAPMYPGRQYYLKSGTAPCRARHRAQAQRQRQHPGDPGGQEPGPERDRRRQHQPEQPHRLRAVRRQSRPRQLHPHRPAEQRHRRRRPVRLLAAPRRQHRLAGAHRRQGPSRGHQASAAGGDLDDGPVRVGQVHHRQPAGEPPARSEPAHLHPRRRQRPSRPEPRPRLYRRRPGGEHPPGRRGGR
jgi:hypothetical protein